MAGQDLDVAEPATQSTSSQQDSTSTAMPRLPVETRFGSMILMMRDAVRCRKALEATVMSDLITEDYQDDMQMQVMPALANRH